MYMYVHRAHRTMAGTSLIYATARTTSSGGRDVISETIITEVQKHRALYDPGCKDYNDVPFKGNLWLAIAARLDIDEKTCRKKWRNLRDQYIKKNKKLKTVSRQAASRIRKWKYMDIMDFLVPYIVDRETESSLRQSHERVESQEQFPSVEEVASEDEEDGEEGGDSEIEMVSLPTSRSEVSIPEPTVSSIPQAGLSPSDVPSWTSTGSRTCKRQRKSKNDFDTETIQDYFRHRHQMSVSRPGSTTPKSCIPKDEDEYFMLSCVPTLRKLSPYRKMEVKCKIQQLLLEYTPRDVSP